MVRANVQYDTATLVRWSPDSKAILAVRALENNIEIYKVVKKPENGLLSVQPSLAYQKVIRIHIIFLKYQIIPNCG